jgi:hypothetical protein
MKPNLPYEIINFILKMKSDLEEMPVYTCFSLNGREHYKINRHFIDKKLEVLLNFKKNNPPQKIYLRFYQKGLVSQIGYSICHFFPMKNNTSFQYLIQDVWSFSTNYVWIKFVKKYPIVTPVFERGWASVLNPRLNINVQYPIVGSPRYSEIYFYPNTFYEYLTFRLTDIDTVPPLHFCSQFFYTLNSSFYKEYNENLQKFTHKILPKYFDKYLFSKNRYEEKYNDF